jgi:hypothetical protein
MLEVLRTTEFIEWLTGLRDIQARAGLPSGSIASRKATSATPNQSATG